MVIAKASMMWLMARSSSLMRVKSFLSKTSSFTRCVSIIFCHLSDVRTSDKWQKMMLTHRVKLDVFDKNDFTRIRLEDRAINHIIEALAITIRQKLEGARCASRRP